MRSHGFVFRQNVHVLPDMRKTHRCVKPKEDLQRRGNGGDDRPGDVVVEFQLERVGFVFRRRRCFFEPEAQIEHDKERDHLARRIFVFARLIEALA